MKIKEMFAAGRPTISFEFFPAKTAEGYNALTKTIYELKELNPTFVSMTYGAGGSTREDTIRLVSKIKNNIGIEAAAHLTCVGHSREEIKIVLEKLRDENIENIVALRGDPPKGENIFKPSPDGFRYASELVAFIRQNFTFSIAVAGYPEKHVEAPSIETDLAHLKEKVKAGGDFIITQLFFSSKDYFSYVEKVKALGIDIPVVAGIMPITDVDQIKRFSHMCGAKLPADLLGKLDGVKSEKERVVQIGIDHAVQQCRELLNNGAPGIHFYTLNKSHSTREIFQKLKNEGLVK